MRYAVEITAYPVNIIESNLINNFLVCIDDMERKEKDLSISSVLGLISTLKEEKNCKIILIFNDEMLDEDTKKGLNEYREKIVDIELSYIPTIYENLKIIWPDGPAQSTHDLFRKLKLNNIRIMQKVKWIQKYFEDKIKGSYPHLYNRFMEKAACLSIYYHAYSKDFELTEIMDRSFAMYSMLDGYVNIEKHEEVLSKANEKYRVSDISSAYQEFRNTFDSIFDKAIDIHVERLEDRDIIYSSLPGKTADKLRQKIKDRKIKRIPIPDLFNKLAMRDSWHSVDMEYLSIYEKDDFYNWIMQEDANVILMIHSFFERFDRPDKNEITELIISNIKAALDDVKSRSNLDELRVNICNNYK